IGAAEAAVGDEATSTGECHQPQRTVPGHRDRARSFGVGAQLLVVRREEAIRVCHARQCSVEVPGWQPDYQQCCCPQTLQRNSTEFCPEGTSPDRSDLPALDLVSTL